jgi:putative SOS response-associated peptidase YedK
MCSHYEAVKNPSTLKTHFKVEEIPEGGKLDMWPGYMGLFIRNQDAAVPSESANTIELMIGSFGLIPHWANDTKIARNTYNARSETVAEKPSYRDSWKWGRRCIIPADAIYEPDWRTGKAVPAKISRADGKPLGIAGIWSIWKSPSGETIHSYTMLTINADDHPLMKQFHKIDDEKRMVVILEDDQYTEWLNASTRECTHLLKALPAERLSAESKQSQL